MKLKTFGFISGLIGFLTCIPISLAFLVLSAFISAITQNVITTIFMYIYFLSIVLSFISCTFYYPKPKIAFILYIITSILNAILPLILLFSSPFGGIITLIPTILFITTTIISSKNIRTKT